LVIEGEVPHIMSILSKSSRAFRLVIPFFLFAVIAMAGDDNATGSDDSSDEDSDDYTGEYFQLENCIRRSSIRSTNIIDDRTIIFYMSQQKIYVNHLPNRCSGLRSAGTFSYRTHGSQLCSVDMITVVRSMGRGLNTGPSCGLGKFRPVTKEEVAMIKNKDVELPSQESAPVDDSDDSDGSSDSSEKASD
jgi:hypothetical protein